MTVNRRTLWLLCGFALVAFGFIRTPACFAQEKPATTSVSKPADGADEDWSVIYMGKDRVGYSRSTTLKVKRNGEELIRSEVEQFIVMVRFGQKATMKMVMASEETQDGELRSLEVISDNPPLQATKTTGKVVGDKLELTIANPKKTTQKKLTWDKANKSPAYQDRLLKEKPLQPNEKISFKVFMPELNIIATATMVGKEPEEVKLFDGKTEKLQRIDSSMEGIPFTTKSWVDKEGHALKTHIPGLLGTDMTIYRVDKAEALKEVSGASLDVAVNTLIKISPPIERAHEAQQIVYEVTIKGHDPVKEIPSGSTQQLKSTGPETAELTVTRVRPKPGNQTSSAKVGDQFLSPNRFLQSDDKKVIQHANAAADGSTDPWNIAVKMEQYVHEKLASKNFSTALGTAAEVADNLEGDCTEHAVLLAAMCRVKHISSRVAVGFVYAEPLEAFGGHMWTEVFINGEWIPLDATLGRGGIGAGHIKLADTSFADDDNGGIAAFLPIIRVIGNMSLKVKSITHRQ